MLVFFPLLPKGIHRPSTGLDALRALKENIYRRIAQDMRKYAKRFFFLFLVDYEHVGVEGDEVIKHVKKKMNKYGLRVKYYKTLTSRLFRITVEVRGREETLYLLIQGKDKGIEDEACIFLRMINIPCSEAHQVHELVRRRRVRLEEEIPRHKNETSEAFPHHFQLFSFYITDNPG